VVWSQHDAHQPYGGGVPGIAARAHVERVDHAVMKAMREAAIDFTMLDGIAATAGPGLVGGVMVGLTAGKAISMTHGIPLVPINHLEGHALSARMTEPADYPYLLLLISGGHTQLIHVEALGQYRRLGSTIDDAAGEAFDKTAKLLGLGQPGGPRIESAATGGRSDRYDFPKPLAKRPGCDFSFSGMKTAVREAAEALRGPTGQDIADIAASFQYAVARHLAAQTEKAMDMASINSEKARLVIAGGVAANCTIKSMLSSLCELKGWVLLAPPPKYCTDNGAMVAWAGAEHLNEGYNVSDEEALGFAPRARWPLAPPIEGAEIGGGRKGPKA